MKRSPFLLFAGLMMASAHGQLSYTFDADAQGWRRADFNETTLALTDLGPATWNAGGYITGDDFSNWAFHLSPDLGGLDAEDAYGTNFTFDFSTAGGGTPAPFVVLTDGTGALYQLHTWTGGGAFESFSYRLDSTGGWLYGTTATNSAPATEAQIRSVLGSLTRIGVTSDVVNGGDSTRLDNLHLNPVPEPASMLVLGLGAAAMLRRRRALRR